jgi:hypothetical protein
MALEVQQSRLGMLLLSMIISRRNLRLIAVYQFSNEES